MTPSMIWYISLSCFFLGAAIWVMIDDDKDNSECFYPPPFGYNFKGPEGNFRISKKAWIFMLAVAPFTNIVVVPAICIMLIFRKKD